MLSKRNEWQENPYEASCVNTPSRRQPLQEWIFVVLVPCLPIAFAALTLAANVFDSLVLRIGSFFCIAFCAPVAIRASRKWCLVILLGQLVFTIGLTIAGMWVRFNLLAN